MLTNLRMSLHLEHLDAFDKGSARVVDAVEHRLETTVRVSGRGTEKT